MSSSGHGDGTLAPTVSSPFPLQSPAQSREYCEKHQGVFSQDVHGETASMASQKVTRGRAGNTRAQADTGKSAPRAGMRERGLSTRHRAGSITEEKAQEGGRDT